MRLRQIVDALADAPGKASRAFGCMHPITVEDSASVVDRGLWSVVPIAHDMMGTFVGVRLPPGADIERATLVRFEGGVGETCGMPSDNYTSSGRCS